MKYLKDSIDLLGVGTITGRIRICHSSTLRLGSFLGGSPMLITINMCYLVHRQQ